MADVPGYTNEKADTGKNGPMTEKGTKTGTQIRLSVQSLKLGYPGKYFRTHLKCIFLINKQHKN
jgi:hypothetical protein